MRSVQPSVSRSLILNQNSATSVYIMFIIDLLKLDLNKKSKIGLISAFPEGDFIPKKIHQTYPNGKLPNEIRTNIEKIKTLNPGWEYKLYDDDDIQQYIFENYPATVLEYFNRINKRYGAAKADVFRYLLLYKEGGVYLDIKSSLNRSLDDVLLVNDKYILSHWDDSKGSAREGWGRHRDLKNFSAGEFQQWFIISVPGHPFLKKVLENVLSNIECYIPELHGTGRIGVLRLTGPIAYTLAIAPLINSGSYRNVKSEKELGIEYSFFEKTSSENSHTSLFHAHYSVLTESIIAMKPFNKTVSFLLSLAKKARLLLR